MLLRRAKYVRVRSKLPQNLNKTTSHLPEVFKSRYTHDFNTDTDFFSFMAKDIESVSDKTAVVCGASGRSLTYQQLFDQAKQIGFSLQKRGYRPGDMAAIFSPNIPEYILTILGETFSAFLVVSHDSIRGCVRPLVRWSDGPLVPRLVMLLSRRAETSRRMTYFVYTNLYL